MGHIPPGESPEEGYRPGLDTRVKEEGEGVPLPVGPGGEREAHGLRVGGPGDLEVALQDDVGDVVLVDEDHADDLKGHPEVEWSSSAQSTRLTMRPFS